MDAIVNTIHLKNKCNSEISSLETSSKYVRRINIKLFYKTIHTQKVLSTIQQKTPFPIFIVSQLNSTTFVQNVAKLRGMFGYWSTKIVIEYF